eukprot:TRINITY_DN29206_c0_g1_i1.p1 TRINITY_DN29206_c0_g1~~TRINITY_DN29206_c0_g1_i1.p1  ORF type:complete len:594 (+),score=129.83 TRINITY_DN29206_c0_g1_i1:60-1784(+)
MSGVGKHVQSTLHKIKEKHQERIAEAETAGKYYPGMYLKRGVDALKEAKEEVQRQKEAGTFEPPKAGGTLMRGLNILKAQRKRLARRGSDEGQVGTVTVKVLRGKLQTKRPFLLLEMDGNEARTSTALSSTPQWGDAEFTFPVFDPSSDLRLFLFDEQSIKGRSKGRVIIPLQSLCTSGCLPRPKPAFRAVFQIMPACRQHSDHLQARYGEAAVGVPGTGMVRPATDIGTLELELALRLDGAGGRCCLRGGLLAAYAAALPPHHYEDEQSDSDGEATNVKHEKPHSKETKFDGKTLRLYIARLKRLFGAPYVLRRPWCFGLLLLHVWACFFAAVYQLPLALFILIISNGALSRRYRHERMELLIYWEDSVGEDEMPQGLAYIKLLISGLGALQKALGNAATFLERCENVFNFEDPPVSLAAMLVFGVACVLLSLLLWLIPANFVVFVFGVIALAPALAGPRFSGRKASAPADEHAARRPRPRAVQAMVNVFSRIPDSRDVAHRHFFDSYQRIASLPGGPAASVAASSGSAATSSAAAPSFRPVVAAATASDAIASVGAPARGGHGALARPLLLP